MSPRRLAFWGALALGLALLPPLAHAQSVSIDLGQAGAAGQAGATSRLVQLTALVTGLSLAPSLLVMVTAFTRIVIVLSLLQGAIGAQGTPPNMVLIGLALFLTFAVMQPVLDQAWSTGLLPMSEGKVGRPRRPAPRRRAIPPLHGGECAPGRPAALPRHRQARFPAEPGPGALARAHSRLHGGRAAPRLRNGLSCSICPSS